MEHELQICSEPILVDTKAVAALLGISPRHFAGLERAGHTGRMKIYLILYFTPADPVVKLWLKFRSICLQQLTHNPLLFITGEQSDE